MHSPRASLCAASSYKTIKPILKKKFVEYITIAFTDERKWIREKSRFKNIKNEVF